MAQTNFNNNLLFAEADYCIEHELTNSIADFIIRRTGRLYFERSEMNKQLPSLSSFFQQQIQLPTEVDEMFAKQFDIEYQGVLSFK